jgi:small nuclear ribonucleoprotein (snRNP)-like protein
MNCSHYQRHFSPTFLGRTYLDKTISLHLNKGRKVTGTLRGYDQFMNIVLGDTVEEVAGAAGNNIGMVVRAKIFVKEH